MAFVFGLIVGVFSVWNGRMTRRELGEVIERSHGGTQQLIRETQQLIKEEQVANRELLLRLHQTGILGGEGG